MQNDKQLIIFFIFNLFLCISFIGLIATKDKLETEIIKENPAIIQETEEKDNKGRVRIWPILDIEWDKD